MACSTAQKMPEFWHHRCSETHRESVVVYWIDHKGEKLGPMKAIDALRRARGPTRVYDGETWFTIGDSLDSGDPPIPDAQARDSKRNLIRKAG
jgi:hypothetical protein